jgi:hypothetical protein
MEVILLNNYGEMIINGFIITPFELTGNRWCFGKGWLDVESVDFNAYFPVGSYSFYIVTIADLIF